MVIRRTQGWIRHRRRASLLVRLVLALAATVFVSVPLGASIVSPGAAEAAAPVQVRPQGPCDIYAAGGTPCVAAHSTTRALYAGYTGPLYQVQRVSDGATKDIGVVAPTATDGGGYADASAQDAFCARSTCLITTVYDQSPHHNDLTQAPRGAFTGSALGGQNNLPVADLAPVTVSGHQVYGVFISPGTGLRDNDTDGIAVDDQAEGMYWVVDGHHYNSGCCFDYGNAETDSHDDGDGTMETLYFGNSTGWYHGQGNGPWLMTDQENNLVGCTNPGSSSKTCADLAPITSRFVTGMAKGEPSHWATLAGDAQQGDLSTLYDGARVGPSYDPMRKQGAIVLGNGGDNSNSSAGTFYEGVMTDGYPSDATDRAVQANVVAASYAVPRLSLAPTSAGGTPSGLQTFAPGISQSVTQTYTNTSATPVSDVRLSVGAPDGWAVVATGSTGTSAGDTTTFDQVAAGASVSATFRVTAGRADFEGNLVGQAGWTEQGQDTERTETATERVRNTSAVKINEFRVGTSSDATDAFIELYNAGGSTVDLSNWTLTQHATQQAVSSAITIPAGTTLPAGKTYVLGLAPSSLVLPAKAGDSSVALRQTSGLAVGQQIQVGDGPGAETRTITSLTDTTAAGPRVAGRIGNAVRLDGNDEYAALPAGIVSGLDDFTVSAWVNPSADATWSRIFDFGTGTSAYMFLSVNAGGSGLRFAITNGGNSKEQLLTGGGQLPLDTWSHVAVTLSGTTGRLYLDGALVATNTAMTLTPAGLGTTGQNWIGRSQFADPYLDAAVDDFQIYDRALSADEVTALAAGQAGAGDVASYSFDEASGSTVHDSSGNGHDATITSTASTSGGTTLWQPMPDGPIAIDAGSTNVPVTSTSAFQVGQRITIGAGSTLDTATVTAVGRAGTQAYVAATAAAGATTLKVTSTGNISVGDRIRLDIGARAETVTVASVGSAGSGGSGLTLTAPLQFAHSANLPFSDRGTGITFSPATTFRHASNEAVQALPSSVGLDHPLTAGHPLDTPVLDAGVTSAGYQGAPDQWFGGPALSTNGGSMVLQTATGATADSLDYGTLVDPWLGEGDQSGARVCVAPTPALSAGAGTSVTRHPDGADTDSNCADFTTTTTPTPGDSSTVGSGHAVSLRATTGGDAAPFVQHSATDDSVAVAAVSAASSQTEKRDATFLETAGLADASCVSFESLDTPGSYLRHYSYVLHLQHDDGSTTFAQDATFCPVTGNSGTGTSFRSVNYPTKYIRAYEGGVYLAGDGGSNAWDTDTGWAADTSWVVADPWAPLHAITGFEPVAVTTTVGAAPVLPATVTADLDDGSQQALAVTWDALAPSQYAAPGLVTVRGTVAGTDLRPTAEIAVTSTGTAAPVATSISAPAVRQTYGAPATLAVTVSPGATGAVTVHAGTTTLTGELSDGHASVVLPAKALAPGQRTVLVTYPGAGTAFAPSVATTTVSVAKATPLVHAVAKRAHVRRGGLVKLRISVTAPGVTPTGTVRVKVAGTRHTVRLSRNGTATVKVRIRPHARPGATHVRVTYRGDGYVTRAGTRLRVTVRR